MSLLHTRCQKASIYIYRHDVNILIFILIINDLEFVPKFSRNDPKIVSKLLLNFHEMIKIVLKLSQICPKIIRKLFHKNASILLKKLCTSRPENQRTREPENRRK